ncbi:Methyltransferase domain-containing protein [Agromyces sp. CF514]|uniref:class I SAM-dependent methyltransferase n=1 Tax=Agromyces sp. CF514 TaxID=1881031 RepID=UPI0008E9C0BA|nr:class I SAM-dependent methyltransferase [Agromyces sp. CF514]SFR86336.1 Methyltransferase domain-containing protein [Agromyces sp. CF514]
MGKPPTPPPLAPRALLRWSLVRRHVDRIDPVRIIEFGCGEGSVGARLAPGRDYLGVEPDSTSAARATEVVSPAGGRVLNAFPSSVDLGEPADLVCAFEVLEHIDDDSTALGEWVAAAKPGGRVLLSVPAFAHRFGASDVRSGHFRRYEPEALRELMQQAGLVDVRVEVYAWPLGYLLEAVRNRRDGRIVAASEATIQDFTAASGRTGQPRSRLLGAAILIGTSPFLVLQRLNRRRGTGLVAVGTRPAG